MSVFQSIEKVLAERQTPIKVFFRNDDGGWADKRLQQLTYDFIQQELPLDIAVIPDALTEQSAEVINSLLDAEGRVAIHQHGFSHNNHQLSGRSCEFGTDRNSIQQRDDIEKGQKRLAAVFGSRVKPIFTPPWNRCTRETTVALQSLGFQYLSRIIGSEPIESTIPELPVAIDWLKKRNGKRLNTAELIEYMGGLFNTNDEIVGVMLHHEHMDQENRMLLNQFIESLRQSQMVSFESMMDVVSQPH